MLEVATLYRDVIKVAVDKPATDEPRVGDLGSSEVAADEYTVQEFGVLNERLLKADVSKRAVSEFATHDVLFIEPYRTEYTILSVIWGLEVGDGSPDEVGS